MKSKRGGSAGRAPKPAHGAVFVPAIILFVALALRSVSLTTFEPLFDEQITRDVVSGLWHGEWSNNWKYTVTAANYRTDQYNFSSYLYTDALLAGTAARLDAFLSNGAPDFVFWSRLLSALAGTLGVLLFYLVARRLFDPGTAILALLLMAAMPLLVQDSHYARPEAFVVALTGAAYLLLLAFDFESARWRYLGAAAFCFGLLIACKISLLPMAAVPLLFLLRVQDRRWWMRAALICGGCTLLGVFVGVPDAFFHPAAFWRGVQFLRHQYAEGRPPHASMGGTSVALTAMYFWQTTGVLLLFSLVGGLVLARTRRFVLLAAIGGPVLFYLAYFSLQRAFFERNLSHVAPLMAILAAAGVTAIAAQIPLKMRTAVLFAMLAVAATPALWVSGKLVFVAMRTRPEQRAVDYEGMLMQKAGKIGGTMPLFTEGQLQYATQLAATLDEDALLRVPDYHDDFTRKHLEELERRTSWREVGYFPSLFEGFDVNTIIAYHDLSFHYLFTKAPPR